MKQINCQKKTGNLPEKNWQLLNCGRNSQNMLFFPAIHGGIVMSYENDYIFVRRYKNDYIFKEFLVWTLIKTCFDSEMRKSQFLEIISLNNLIKKPYPDAEYPDAG
jgi:hypothetical protein